MSGTLVILVAAGVALILTIFVFRWRQSAEGLPLLLCTPRLKRVLAAAHSEALRLGHNYVGTEHLLLGLCALGEGVAANVLRELGVDLARAREAVEQQVGSTTTPVMPGRLPYTPRARKVFSLTIQAAKELQHSYLGTEHLLLGLLREGQGVAARVLAASKIDFAQAQLAVRKELDPSFADA